VEKIFFEASAPLKEVRPVASPYGVRALSDFEAESGEVGDVGNVWDTLLEWPVVTMSGGADAMAG
jgi:hypothetical protein